MSVRAAGMLRPLEHARVRDTDASSLRDAMRKAAHDIRTPLAAVTQGIDALIHIEDANGDGAQHLFNVVRRNVVLMGELLAGSLDHASRAESAMSTMVDVGELARDVVALIDPVLRTRQQTAVVRITGGRARIIGDHGSLARVLLNLVDNASKYGPVGDEIVIRVAKRKTATVVAVHDHGPGIPLGERTAIFRAFYRTDGAKRSGIPGSGLGLSVVREQIAAHGGTVGAGRARGETRVWFSIPNRKSRRTA